MNSCGSKCKSIIFVCFSRVIFFYLYFYRFMGNGHQICGSADRVGPPEELEV